jgi:hypothetical protein
MNIKGAFPLLEKEQMVETLKEYDCPVTIQRWIKSFLSGRKGRMIFHRQTSEEFEIETGTA